MYLGSWKIDDVLTFPANTHSSTTGAATDADAVPAYRVYEDETGTAILNGSMAKLDDANTTGFYSEQITLSAANGFEKGKCYTIYISAAVSSVTGTMNHTFQIEAEVDANAVSNLGAGVITAAAIATGAVDADALATDAVAEIADGVWDEARSGHTTAGTYGESFLGVVNGEAATGTLTTTAFTTNLTEATDDHYNGRIVVFITGVLAGQATDITDYTGATKLVTVTAMTEAPSNGDRFVIV